MLEKWNRLHRNLKGNCFQSPMSSMGLSVVGVMLLDIILSKTVILSVFGLEIHIANHCTISSCFLNTSLPLENEHTTDCMISEQQSAKHT